MDSVNKVRRMVFIVFLCLGFMAYAVATTQGVSQPASAKTKAQLKQEEKARKAQALKAKREAAAKAKREAAAKAKRDAIEEAKAKLKEQIAQLNLPEDTTPRLTVKQIRISGNTLISTDVLLENMPLIYNVSGKPLDQAESNYLYDFRTLHDIILQPGQPREVSTRTIQGFTQYILSVYQARNYAGIYVYVPAEALKDGKELQDEILAIEVLEATVTDVTVKSYDPNQNEVEKGYLRSSAVQKWSPIKAGQVANKKELDDFVNLLNLNPDRYVSAVVTKGADPKSLAVEYDIYEADPWHYFLQIDNSGTRDRQWMPRVGLINTNLLGFDDTFTAIYQAPPESDWDKNYSLYGSYDFPLLGPRLRFNLYGGYSQFDINPESGIVDFIGNGDFYGGILRYNLLQTNGWFFDIKGSLEHVRSKVTPSLFPGILGTDVKFWLWGWGLNLRRSDDMSNTSFGFDRVESMGGGSSGAEFGTARTNAKSDFSVYTASATHSQYLDTDKIDRLSSTFRWIGSNERLVPAKMTTFGGMYSVRGYDEYEVVADGGVLASAQYEFDLVKYDEFKEKARAGSEQTQAKTGKPFLRKLAPLAFFDYGRAKIRRPLATEKAYTEMFSAGVGTIVELGNNFSGGVYYGYPLRATADTRKGKGRLNISLIMRW
ncbi:MAG TPA: ShlB/FhaC/HecB family hemolysin secretion/activation protein [Phycisphaerales bacterium]|nr:ShlB/FhaC/HecB family hemolysin secretion/activation protein [Phycisphaerales bacterium]